MFEPNTTINERRWEFMRPVLFLHERKTSAGPRLQLCGAADTIVALRDHCAPAMPGRPRRGQGVAVDAVWVWACASAGPAAPLLAGRTGLGRRRYWQVNHVNGAVSGALVVMSRKFDQLGEVSLRFGGEKSEKVYQPLDVLIGLLY